MVWPAQPRRSPAVGTVGLVGGARCIGVAAAAGPNGAPHSCPKSLAWDARRI
jgi:hypothetical protein